MQEQKPAFSSALIFQEFQVLLYNIRLLLFPHNLFFRYSFHSQCCILTLCWNSNLMARKFQTIHSSRLPETLKSNSNCQDNCQKTSNKNLFHYSFLFH